MGYCSVQLPENHHSERSGYTWREVFLSDKAVEGDGIGGEGVGTAIPGKGRTSQEES